MTNIGFLFIAVGVASLLVTAALVSQHRKGKAFAGDPRKLPYYRMIVAMSCFMGIFCILGGILLLLFPAR